MLDITAKSHICQCGQNNTNTQADGEVIKNKVYAMWFQTSDNLGKAMPRNRSLIRDCMIAFFIKLITRMEYSR